MAEVGTVIPPAATIILGNVISLPAAPPPKVMVLQLMIPLTSKAYPVPGADTPIPNALPIYTFPFMETSPATDNREFNEASFATTIEPPTTVFPPIKSLLFKETSPTKLVFPPTYKLAFNDVSAATNNRLFNKASDNPVNTPVKVVVPPTINRLFKEASDKAVTNPVKVDVPPTINRLFNDASDNAVSNPVNVEVPPTIKRAFNDASDNAVTNPSKVVVPPTSK